MAKNNIINVNLFGKEIGRIGFDELQKRSSFQYNPSFLESRETSNIFPRTGVIKSLSNVQVFSQFNNDTFKGLPPQIADSLPDMFGNLIFKTWLEATNKSEITILEQLAYVSNRGMGALEYTPSKHITKETTINLDEIINVLKSVLDLKKSAKQYDFNTEALINIFKIGTSAGGARPKILISKNKESGEIIPGDLEYSNAYEHFLVKLALDQDIEYPRERVEYCYYLTAREIGITMMDSSLIDDRHFATMRYDRQEGRKQHILTASGMTGWDFKESDNSSYENLFKLSSFLKVSHAEMEQLYLRMIFNVIFQNTDDHLKNHSYIYDPIKDNWGISPAYDLTYALNPLIDFKKTNRALSINHKRNSINLDDVLKIADEFTIKNPKGIIKKINAGIEILHHHMNEHDIPTRVKESILQKVKPINC